VPDGVVTIEPVARAYAWGSTTAIPRLLGHEPGDQPLAELWFGAHADSPSATSAGPLDEAIAADPVQALGPEVAARFDGQLPFLLKILAADHPLSIQVHPTLAQAQAGYADEQRRGIAPDAPDRNYRDRNHKPELLCALTDFDALCGFRPVAKTLELLDALGVPELAPVGAALRGTSPLRTAFALLLAWPQDDRDALISSVIAGCRRLVDSGWSLTAAATLRAAADFPGDIGAVIALLLNAVRLRPGEAIYLAAGNIHAYLRGMGVEIMANSDNVLRCGLTPKHVDIAELLAITDFAPTIDPVRNPGHVGYAAWGVDVPVPDFELTMYDLDLNRGAVDANGSGPEIWLCVSGQVSVRVLGQSVDLRPGQAAFVPGGSLRTVIINGTGTIFSAAVGDLDRAEPSS
jgi:mannose-6-phosphate isomerase